MTRNEKILVIAITILSAALVSRGPASLTGDTIHYLALSHSLAFDRDFDVGNQYVRDGDYIFFPGNADGHTRRGRNGNLYTLHPLGLPIGITPIYALAATVTSTIPESVLESVRWDRARACRDLLSLAMVLLYGWTAVLTLRTTKRILENEPGVEIAVWIAFLTPPLLSLSILVFPELPAAFLVAWFLSEVTKPKPSRWAAILPLAILPWFHLRLTLLSIVGLSWLIAKERRQGRSGWASLIATAPLVVFSCALLILSSWWMFGSFSLIRDQGLLAGMGGLPGLLLDPDYGLLIIAPFWLVALAGVGPLRRLQPDYLVFALWGFASLWLAAGLMAEWWGGTSPSARLLVPSLPLIVPFLALGLKRFELSWKRWPSYAMVAWSFGVTLILLIEPARMWVDPDKGLSLLPSSFDFATTRFAKGRLESAGIEVSQRNFMESVRKGDVDSVRLFLEAGFNPPAALSEAARVGHAEIVEVLLEHVDPKSLSAATALGWAKSRGNSECARILLEAGARLEARTRVEETALIRAAELGRLRELRALIKAGADVNATTNAGMTALMWLAQSGHEMGVRTVIRAGGDVNRPDRDGWTPLMLAARAGAKDTVDILLAENAGINDVTVMGWTALLWAAYEGHPSVVEALLKAGANVNFQSKAGQTALIRAAQRGHREVVRLLVESGAVISVTANGLDARGWAELNGRRDVVRALEDAERD